MGLRLVLHVAAALALAFGLANCAAPGSNAPAPTSTNGSELFAFKALGANPGCVTCHSLSPDHVLVGPSLAGLADRAGGRVGGMDAAEYLHRSIVAPADHIVATFDGPEMPDTYGETLSDEQIDALVQYLLEST